MYEQHSVKSRGAERQLKGQKLKRLKELSNMRSFILRNWNRRGIRVGRQAAVSR